MSDTPQVHDRARRTHEEAVGRHEAAARFWDEHGDPERADLERRNAEIERQAAALEGDRARIARERLVEH